MKSFLRQTFLFILAFSYLISVSAQLKVSRNGRYLITTENEPFFYLGDTAWELFHRLSRPEAIDYIENRAVKGFNVIQAVVLAEYDGLTEANPQNHIPLNLNDPTQPNEAYFQDVDYLIDTANALGLYIGLLPTWGDKWNQRWGIGPEIFSPENARKYGEFLAQRYEDKMIIWILGGDRIPEEERHFEIIRAMAEGIRSVVGNKQLITFHPMGGRSSATFFHDDEWLDFNMFQSSHGTLNNPNYKMTQADYRLTLVKPVIDGEPCYEDHPINWNKENGYFDDFDCRRAGYWSIISGAAGHTYGNHNIWQFFSPKHSPISQARTHWQQAIDMPGAFQAGIMKSVFETFDWSQIQPDQTIIASGPNTGGMEILAAVARDGSFIVAYTPYGSDFSLDLTTLNKDKLIAIWFDPRSGHQINLPNFSKNKEQYFDPPYDEQRGNDWFLLIKTEN